MSVVSDVPLPIPTQGRIGYCFCYLRIGLGVNRVGPLMS
jgi:hypothetical protein